MKIAVFSLLRLGDSLQHLQMFNQSLVSKENIEVTWIADESSAPIKTILPDNFKLVLFPRKKLQAMLVEGLSSSVRAAHLLDVWVSQLGKFDQLINFTHTKFAFRLSKLVVADEKHGVDLANPWSNYLNKYLDHHTLPELPYFQLQSLALGIDLKLPEAQYPKKLNLMACHVASSQKEKNFSDDFFKQSLILLKKHYTDLKVILLGAPGEERELQQRFNLEFIEVYCANLKDTRRLLGKVDMLLGVDSSMLHLAALDNVPSIGLFQSPACPEKIFPLSLSAYAVDKFAETPVAKDLVESICAYVERQDVRNLRYLSKAGPVFSLSGLDKLERWENWPLLQRPVDYNY